jgi:hypothetical protein
MKWFTQKPSWLASAPILRYTAMISLLSIFLIGPLLTANWIKVGESIEQVLRVVELDRGIREGYLYPRWFGDLAGGFGYPYFVFYSPLIYYISELFHLLGFGIVTSLKCMMIIGVIIAGIGMFMFAKSFWGERGALVSAVAYVYVPYRMVNLYIRGDLAEAFAMSLIPLILYFFYRLMTEKRLFCLLGATLSYAMLIFTHNCTALIFSGFLLFFVAFISAQNKDWSGLSKALVAIIWAFGLSAVFWLPALLEKKWVNIELIYSNAAFDFHNNFVEPFRLLSPIWNLDAGIGGRNLPFQIGAPHILLSILSIAFIAKLDTQNVKHRKELSLFFLMSGIFVVYCTNASSVLLWENLPLMKYIQFPWRLLSLLAVCVSFLSGGLFAYFRMESKAIEQVLQIVFVITIILSNTQYCYVRGYYIVDEKMMTPSFVREYGGTISSYNTDKMDRIQDFGEYLPKSVKKLPEKRKAGCVFATKGKVRIMDLRTSIQRYEFRSVAQENAEITIGSFYYPSWRAVIDGKPVSLFTDGEGLIHLRVPRGVHQIEVFFGDTMTRKLAGYMTILSFFAVLALSLGSGMKRVWRAFPKVTGSN